VISRVATFDTGNIPYPLFMLIGVLPWTFFVSSLKFGTNSLASNINLVTKIYFPREVFPFSAVGACFADFLVACLLLVGVMVFYSLQGQAFFSFWVLFVPIIVIFQILFTAGLSLLLAMANLFFRDTKYIVDGILTIGVFATPVYYPLHGMFLLNPMTPILNIYRDLLAYGRAPAWDTVSYVAAISLCTFFIGWISFRRSEFLFAEYI